MPIKYLWTIQITRKTIKNGETRTESYLTNYTEAEKIRQQLR